MTATIRLVHQARLPPPRALRACFGAFTLVDATPRWKLDVRAGQLTSDAFCNGVGWYVDDDWGVSTLWIEFEGRLWQANLDLDFDEDEPGDVGWELWQYGSGLRCAGEAACVDEAIAQVVLALNALVMQHPGIQ